MEIKIDGQTIVLTEVQAQQFRTAILKETDVPKPKHCAMSLYCKPAKGTYRMVVGYITGNVLPKSYGLDSTADSRTGRDFSQTELRDFIRDLKAYAKLVWPNFKT